MPRSAAGSDFGSGRRRRLSTAALYFICDATPDGLDLGETISEALRGGAAIVQLRDKRHDRASLIGAAETIAAVCREHAALFIVNDDPELARAVAADGVHLGQEDMPIEQAREILGGEALIGLSTHSPAQIDSAVAAAHAGGGPDYIGVGPIFATPTKPERAAVGGDLLDYAARHCDLPFFAIGGVDEGNAGTLREHGARRIAVVRAITRGGQPRAAAEALLRAIGASG